MSRCIIVVSGDMYHQELPDRSSTNGQPRLGLPQGGSANVMLLHPVNMLSGETKDLRSKKREISKMISHNLSISQLACCF